jgi:hypothetical protein
MIGASPCHQRMTRTRVADGGTASRNGGYLRMYWIISRGQTRTTNKGGPPARRWGYPPLTIESRLDTKRVNDPQTCTDSLDKRPKRRNIDVRFGTWSVRGLYRAGSLMTDSRELSRYRLDLMEVQEVRWEDSGAAPAGEYIFFYGMRKDRNELSTGERDH